MRMLALYRAGRQADALTAYQRLRQTLDDERGSGRRPRSSHCTSACSSRTRASIRPPGGRQKPVSATAPPGEEPDEAHRRATPSRSRRRGGLSRRGWAAVTAIVLVAVAALAGLILFMRRRADVTPLPPTVWVRSTPGAPW